VPRFVKRRANPSSDRETATLPTASLSDSFKVTTACRIDSGMVDDAGGKIFLLAM
jgi:hypothetical protein